MLGLGMKNVQKMNARAKKYSKIFMNSDKKKCVVLEKWVNGRVERRWEWEKGWVKDFMQFINIAQPKEGIDDQWVQNIRAQWSIFC